MNRRRIYRAGQVAGGAVTIAGIVACSVAEHEGSVLLALVGVVVLTGCRLAAELPRR